MPPLDAHGTQHHLVGDDRLPPEVSKCPALADGALSIGAPWAFLGRDPVRTVSVESGRYEEKGHDRFTTSSVSTAVEWMSTSWSTSEAGKRSIDPLPI